MDLHSSSVIERTPPSATTLSDVLAADSRPSPSCFRRTRAGCQPRPAQRRCRRAYVGARWHAPPSLPFPDKKARPRRPRRPRSTGRPAFGCSARLSARAGTSKCGTRVGTTSLRANERRAGRCPLPRGDRAVSARRGASVPTSSPVDGEPRDDRLRRSSRVPAGVRRLADAGGGRRSPSQRPPQAQGEPRGQRLGRSYPADLG